MKKLYEKSELSFAIAWIIVYCFLQSLANPLNKIVGVEYSVSAAFCILPLNTPMPSCVASRSLWYVSVHPEDVHRVEYYLRTERSF